MLMQVLIAVLISAGESFQIVLWFLDHRYDQHKCRIVSG